MKLDKAESLRQQLMDYARRESDAGTLRSPIIETHQGRRVRLHYEARPYHANTPADTLANRIDSLRSDWANWLRPVTLEGKRTLDAGCGCGFNLALHGALASVAVGIDLSASALRRARAYVLAEGVSDKVFLIHGDIAQLNLASSSFDVITCIGVLHHIPNHSAALANIARLLDTGGFLLLGIYHNGGRYWHRIKRALVHLFAGSDAARQIRLARRWFDVDEEARRYRIPPDIYVRDSYTVPVEKAFGVRQIVKTLDRVGLVLVQVRPSPSISFRAEVKVKACLPVDASAVDCELTRLRRHHYWCLVQKPDRERTSVAGQPSRLPVRGGPCSSGQTMAFVAPQTSGCGPNYDTV